MHYLKINSLFYILVFLLISGCTTSSYRVLSQGKYGTELSVTPDRLLLQCEWLYDASEPGLYGFMIHVLDDENSVVTVAQGNTLDKESCNDRLKKIGKILGTGKSVYIRGSGDLQEPRAQGKYSYTFPGKGAFRSNGRSLGFMSIANENGGCYDAYSGERAPCPWEPAPPTAEKNK